MARGQREAGCLCLWDAEEDWLEAKEGAGEKEVILDSNSGSSITKGHIEVPPEKVAKVIEVRRLMKKYGISPQEVSCSYEGEDDDGDSSEDEIHEGNREHKNWLYTWLFDPWDQGGGSPPKS